MPRKKTTPTIIDPRTTYDITPARLVLGVATTEPDTTLNPDRAQVAAVADLPRGPLPAHLMKSSGMPTDGLSLDDTIAHLKAASGGKTERIPSAWGPIRASLPRDTPPEEVIRVARFYDELKAAGETMPILAGKTFRSVEDLTLYLSAPPAGDVLNRAIVVDSIPEGPRVTEGHTDYEVSADDLRATIAEQSARIATLEKVDHATRTYFNVRLDATQQEVEDAMVREYARVVALESLTPADLIAGYRAVASGQVKAAEWKGRRLVRLHGNPEPIAMYDHPEPPPGCMPSGFVAEVASGTTRIMSPPLKDEAEARAWCEARCGWMVVP